MTGLTATALEKKMSFKEYAHLIARQFGALITMRDDPMDAQIPEEFKPDDYHLRAKQRAEERLAELRRMTIAEAKAELIAQRAEEHAEAEASRKKRSEENDYFERLLMRARDWQPPSPDHQNLKKMMVEQLEMSIDRDDSFWTGQLMNIDAKTPEQYRQEQIDAAAGNIEYHTEGYEKEVETVAKRNLWLKRLRESLTKIA